MITAVLVLMVVLVSILCAAPSTTARVAPSGIRLPDGYKCVVAFSRKPNIGLWEIEVQPFGLDNGDKVDTTTMHNSRYRSFSPRGLIEQTDGSMRVAYDPAAYTSILDLIPSGTYALQWVGSVTYHYPDGTTIDVWGYVKSFEPDGLVEGTMPTANCTIVHTNTDPDGVEAGPVVTSVAGT